MPHCIETEYAPPEPAGSHHYAYSAYLQPNTLHSFIIYDPLLGKAFCQEIITESTAGVFYWANQAQKSYFKILIGKIFK